MLNILNGLTGYFLAVVLLLVIVAALGYQAIVIQHREALIPYTIEKSSSIRMQGGDMNQYYKSGGEKEETL